MIEDETLANRETELWLQSSDTVAMSEAVAIVPNVYATNIIAEQATIM